MVSIEDVKSFCNSQAKSRLQVLDRNSIDKMIIVDEPLFIIAKENKILSKILFNIVSTQYYSAIVEIVMILHILTAFMEPDTPDSLTENDWSGGLISLVLLCIIIEWIDLGLQFYSRKKRFCVRTSMDNKYKSECHRLAGIANNASSSHNPNKNEDSKTKDTFFGEGSSQFSAILVINVLIVINFY